MRWSLACLVVAFAVATILPADAQDLKKTAPPLRYQFWSGTVSDLAEDSVSVRRALPGRDVEVRKFVMTTTTKVDGELRMAARVTVGYVEVDENAVARRILVRTARD